MPVSRARVQAALSCFWVMAKASPATEPAGCSEVPAAVRGPDGQGVAAPSPGRVTTVSDAAGESDRPGGAAGVEER